jgi:P-type Ca2+ transporter type 2C
MSLVADSATAWHTLDADQVARALGTDVDAGLSDAEAARALERHGPNVIPSEPAPSALQILARIWADPMNLMLTVVAAFSFLFDQTGTGVLVVFLVLLNLYLGTSQELKAQQSVSALESMQAPGARVRRGGQVVEIAATEVVPGDVVLLEPGDLVAADGRIVRSASLEAIESGLTGESAPVDKGSATLPDADTALGDRTDMVFQNTSITRGTATVVVTATGSDTEMGKIAGMLSGVQHEPSPLQKEMRSMTIRLAIMAWVAVVIIVVISIARGLPTDQIVLLAITVAISSIPAGLPTFLTAMLSYGAQRLAKAKAVVRNLTDVETLGCTSAINSDKTGTLTMDMMTAVSMFDSGHWFSIEGAGYSKSGATLGAAGAEVPDFTALAYGLTLCSDATVTDEGAVMGDPTEAALVVLAAKMGVDAEISRREYERIALVPFDSSYKFMATFHLAPIEEKLSLVELVKGAPDVLLTRCTTADWLGGVVPIDDVADRIQSANDELGARGLRVMSFAYRVFDPDRAESVQADPMAAVTDLTFSSLVGIIDPLRPSARESVATARAAGIDVRMITGDHAVTAHAIAEDLGLGPGVITGPEFQRLTDAELLSQLDELHVFGRVAPEDKLRLVSVMQQAGQTVAMTGDAVNDAAALKKADVGVAMGSGSEVTKQAAKMVLTDNNFATLVHAIELGRDIYGKITAQLRYVMAGLFGVLLVMLLASALDINAGQALTPIMLIFVTFLVGIFPAIGISTDSVEPGIMHLAPRDPTIAILNRTTTPRWLMYGFAQAVSILLPYFVLGERAADGGPGAGQTTAFAVAGLSTVWIAACVRRDLIPAWTGPHMPYWLWLLIPLALTWFAITYDSMNDILGTQSLTGGQWILAFACSLIVLVVIEADKAIRRFQLGRSSGEASAASSQDRLEVDDLAGPRR